jgi:hypothetical protein
MQVNNSGQGPALIEIDLPQPEPGEGELLISVRAVGVTHTELNWYPTRMRKMEPRASALCPGMSSLVSSPHLEKIPTASTAYRGAVQGKLGYGKVVIRRACDSFSH